MQIYQMNEARLILPDEIVDRSITAFVVPRNGTRNPDDPAEFSFVMTRQEAGADTTLSEYANGQYEMLRDKLPGFRLLRRDPMTLDEMPAVQMDFVWNSGTQKLRQQQTTLFLRRTAITITATVEESQFGRYENLLNRMLYGLQFDRE